MKTNHFLSLMLAIVASAGTLWASDRSVDGIWYNFNGTTKTAEVTYRGSAYYSYDGEYSGEVVIPASVTYGSSTYSVTSIGDEAFSGCSGLTSVTIPNSVTSIGDHAFRGCNSLTNVTIPESITNIGGYAFYNCTGLTSVIIPNNVTYIGNYALSNCSGLTSIVIDNGNTKYDSRNNCNAIIETATNTLILGCESTIIPNSVTSIGDGAFYGCSGLTSVTIPNSVTSIGDYAFYNCSGLTAPIYIEHVFAYMPASYSGEYSIPEGIEIIVGGAFSGCTGLTSVTIPNSVTSIGSSAFYGCTGLTSVTIPESVTSIGSSAFSNCTALTSVTWNAKKCTFPSYYTNAPFYGIRSQITSFEFGDEVESVPSNLCDGMNKLTSISIPNSVKYIGDYAFYNCSGLTSVTIGKSVTSIGNYAFYCCSGLTSVTIPNSVTSIGNYAFYCCSGLTSVTIPNSVTSIGKEAFSGCSMLQHLTLGEGIKSIGSSTFAKCPYIAEFTAKMTLPPAITADIFTGWGDLKEVTLYVPKSSVALYKKTDVWKEFSIQEIANWGDEANVYYLDKDGASLRSERFTFNLPDAPTITDFTFLRWDVIGGAFEDGIYIQAIYEYNGIETSAPAEVVNPANKAQKLIRNGNVYILTDTNTYTIHGQEVR